ncbi:glutaredoxin family protein [Salarchaeum japonicum]|uniref:glutaredoxin family protein n=1 Tax=Salarchaeum japonicum TaxID=555573 RepID=UPI003C71BFDE
MTFDPADEGLDADDVQERVDDAIENNEVVLFMKGTPMMPQCGFSKRAIGLITKYREDVETVDVLQNLDAFRAALEEYSGWETIPQTYVEGEFVGGSDILAELEERGDLAETLNAEDVDVDASDDGDDQTVESPF